jgi:hypothetical protein
MATRRLAELATDIEDAKRLVEELQDAPAVDTSTKLDDIHDKLEDAITIIDELEEGRSRSGR